MGEIMCVVKNKYCLSVRAIETQEKNILLSPTECAQNVKNIKTKKSFMQQGNYGSVTNHVFLTVRELWFFFLYEVSCQFIMPVLQSSVHFSIWNKNEKYCIIHNELNCILTIQCSWFSPCKYKK